MVGQSSPAWHVMREWPDRSLSAWLPRAVDGDSPSLCCPVWHQCGSSGSPSVHPMLWPSESTMSVRIYKSLKLSVQCFAFHLMVLCSYLLDDGSDVTQKHRGKICLLPIVKKAHIQWLKHKRLARAGQKTINEPDNVVFVKVEALDLSQHGNLETQASLTWLVVRS